MTSYRIEPAKKMSHSDALARLAQCMELLVPYEDSFEKTAKDQEALLRELRKNGLSILGALSDLQSDYLGLVAITHRIADELHHAAR